MSIRDEYSAEEWQQIVTAPAAIIAAVIGVSPGGPIQKKGGFLGIGGEAVSPEERTLLGELAGALNV